MKLDLYTRNLQTGDREQKAFDSEEQALAFLENRPKYTEVLGGAEDAPQEGKRSFRPVETGACPRRLKSDF